MEKSIPELFGSLVFNDKVMRERLAPEVYASLKKTVEDGLELEPGIGGFAVAAS